MKIEEVFPKFVKSKILSASPLGDGHINDTFLVDTGESRYVIQRVLERGSLDDIRATVAHYTMPFMIAEAQQIRSLDPVTLAFAACLGNVKEETFRCYSSMR